MERRGIHYREKEFRLVVETMFWQMRDWGEYENEGHLKVRG